MPLIFEILIVIGVTSWFRKSLDTANRIPQWDQILSRIWMGSIAYYILANIPFLTFLGEWYLRIIFVIYLATIYQLREYRSSRQLLLALLPVAVVGVIRFIFSFLTPEFFKSYSVLFDTGKAFAVFWLIGFGIYALIQISKERKMRLEQEEEAREAEARKLELEKLVADRTSELTIQKEKLEQTLSELKAAQNQLVQSEKMASLGQLTAGIAHEIQNPLNFVNNFSQVSTELLAEMKKEIEEGDTEEAIEIIQLLTQNLEKIHHHGERASSIVKGMLQHSRTATGKKEPTDINQLCDEYLRLAYHGMRAKDKSFNVTLKTAFDESLSGDQANSFERKAGVGKVNVIPQDIGRVLLNLLSNAFDAVNEKSQQEKSSYTPVVSLSTHKKENMLEILVKDNGKGIPAEIVDKIFQPFFTTKPTGQGTGLGLSLAYDIIKAHQGELTVESREEEGTTFTISLPQT